MNADLLDSNSLAADTFVRNIAIWMNLFNIIFNCMGKRKVKYHNGFRFLPAKRQFAQENANLNVILFCTIICRVNL